MVSHINANRLATGSAAGWLLVLPAVIFISLGCAGGKLTAVKSESEFQHLVLNADKPALVDFYKAGCPACAMLDPTMDKLAEKYTGRVTFAKVERSEKSIRQRYEIYSYPTVILFVGGTEHQRWTSEFSQAEYERTLDQVLAEPPTSQ